MSVIQIMVTIIIVTILVTVILGVASYGAYWLRRNRGPEGPQEPVETGPRFFYRYVPEGREPAEPAGAEGPDAGATPGPETAAAAANGNGRGPREPEPALTAAD